MNTPDISIDITTTVTLLSILKQMRRQCGQKEIIEGIIEFLCFENDIAFEDALIAAIQKFQEENA